MSNPAEALNRKALLKDALVALDEMQAKLDAMTLAQHAPIAIVGMGCRFPGAANVAAYWDLLREGKDAVREISSARWNPDQFAGLNLPVAWYGGFLDNIDQFDPHFFGISPREASSMDPQQRLVLEVGWEALESAGQAPDQLMGSATGVFLGITTNDYSQMLRQGGAAQMDAYAATGSALNAAAGRLAFTLGLQGPCVAVDTACSSSLVAIHLACQGLRNRECDLAIAGGVNATLTPEAFVCFARWGMMAPDGRCKTFDARADGFVRGEGCGLVVLKRLDDALAQGDNIRAVIRGSAINQDGRSSGLTVPNGLAQQKVLRQALAGAQVNPAQIHYVEAHGTGTALGDPIEVEALGAIFGAGRKADQPLVLGSVKTNLGHLESAAGIAGLIKLVLALQHQAIPPNLHFQGRNENIPWPNFEVVIPTQLLPWPRGTEPRLAGVSAFGFSGTNAHLVIEEAPAHTPIANTLERPRHLLTLSAKSDAALAAMAEQYATYLAASPQLLPGDVAYTANTGRAHFAHRLAITGVDTADWCRQLSAVATSQRAGDRRQGQPAQDERPRIAMLFTGQGAQWANMGRQLYTTQPTFRRTLEKCAELLRPHLDRPLLDVLFPTTPANAQWVDHTMYTQPALFAIEYALAQLWQSWGIRPGAVLGHSVGEYVAATLAGVFSLEDALKLIAARARLMGMLPAGGAMFAVFGEEAQVLAAIEPDSAQVTIAAYNAPDSIVISGAATALEAVVARLTGQGIQTRRLNVSHAFHSPLMAPILDEFTRVAQSVQFARPQTRLISNLSGDEAGAEIAQAAYWRHQIEQPVRFTQGMNTLYQRGYRMFLEVGPHPTLLSIGKRTLSSAQDCVWLPSLRQGRDEWDQLLDSVGTLYTHGVPIDWDGFDKDYARQRVELPTYPYQRQRYWLDMAAPVPPPPARGRLHPFLETQVDLAGNTGTQIWVGELSLERFPYLADHCVQGAAIVPATAYLEMVMAAATQTFGQNSVKLINVENQKVLLLRAGESYQIQVVFTATNDEFDFSVYSRLQKKHDGTSTTGTWQLHVTGHVARLATESVGAAFEPTRTQERCTTVIAGGDFYAMQAQKGNEWGPYFQGVQQLWQGDGEAIARVQIRPEIAREATFYRFHPALSDSSGHVLIGALPLEATRGAKQGAFVGGGIQEVRFYRQPQGEHLWTYARLRPDPDGNANVLFGDIQVMDETGMLVSETVGTRLWYLDQDKQAALLENLDDWFYGVDWQVQPQIGSPDSNPSIQGAWLILSDEGGIGQTLAQQLMVAGGRVVQVLPGPTFAQIAADTFTVRLAQREDMHALIQALGQEQVEWQGIVHLWSLDGPAPDSSGRLLRPAVERSLVSTLHLVQSLTESGWRKLPRLWLVTAGAQPVIPSQPPLTVTQAPLWGFGRSLAVEHPELWNGLVDLEPGVAAKEAAQTLWQTLLNAAGEDQIAWRAKAPYVPRLVRRSPTADHPFRVRADGAYLITGGLGGLGLLVADWLVEQGARHLILLGRTPLPARALWDSLAPDDPVTGRVAAVQRLEGRGAQVVVGAVDVADEQALRAFLAVTDDADGPDVIGVFHAAGVLQYQALVEHSAEEIHRILRAKVDGAWALHQIFADQGLDLFVLFSSASTLLNSPLIASYVAGNAFLDALAYHRQALGLPALSINWGFWAEVGMVTDFTHARESETQSPALQRAVRKIAPAQGLAALARCLQSNLAQVGVMPMDWAQWQASYSSIARVPLFANFLQTHSSAARTQDVMTGEMLRSAAPQEQPELLHRYLKAQVAHVLQLEQDGFSVEEPLTYLGLDSLMALELKNRIEADLQISVPMIHFLQGPSVIELGAHIAEKVTVSPLSTHGETDRVVAEDPPLPEEAERVLLSRLDELSDAGIDELLSQLLTEEESYE